MENSTCKWEPEQTVIGTASQASTGAGKSSKWNLISLWKGLDGAGPERDKGSMAQKTPLSPTHFTLQTHTMMGFKLAATAQERSWSHETVLWKHQHNAKQQWKDKLNSNDD